MKNRPSTGIASGGLQSLGFHPKHRMRRIRTCSSDSGCDVTVSDNLDLNLTIMEDAVNTWGQRLESVVKQEVERCHEVTTWAREALRHASLSEDECRREEVMMSWRLQLEGIMEFTKDLIECVNNDTKELMYDSTGSSGHESTDTIEELIEDDDNEEEIMQLFLLSAMRDGRIAQKKMRQNSNKSLMKEFISIYKRNGKQFRNSRRANKEVQTAYAKVKRHESFAKRRLSWEETKFTEDNFNTNDSDYHFSEKMFESVMDYAEIFSDWNWNFDDENEDYETFFDEWKWNLEVTEDIKQMFYDDPSLEMDYNEYNFWRFEGLRVDLDKGCLADDSDNDDNAWEDCMFWQDNNDNWNIIHNLVDDNSIDDENDFMNYWDENVANQCILKALLDNDDDDFQDNSEEVFLWEEKEPIMSLIEFGSYDENENNFEIDEIFLWNDPKILFALLAIDEEFVKKPDTKIFLWEEPKYIEALLKIDEENDEDLAKNDEELMLWDNPLFAKSLIEEDDEEDVDEHFLWDNPFIAQTLVEEKEEEFGENELLLWDDPEIAKALTEDEDLIIFSDDSEQESWTKWPFWRQIGPKKEIIEAYEICFPNSKTTVKVPVINIEEVFWDICLDDNLPDPKNVPAQVPKDPYNIFKSIRHIFNLPKESQKKKNMKMKSNENHLFDDMEDIFEEWAVIALEDDHDGKAEKKRSSRGRKTSGSKSISTYRRAPTPPVKTKSSNFFDFDSCWIDTKKPNKERRTAFARNQKRLNAKMFAKQPRKIT